jgi:uncharacterized protein (UPF0128 family)
MTAVTQILPHEPLKEIVEPLQFIDIGTDFAKDAVMKGVPKFAL